MIEIKNLTHIYMKDSAVERKALDDVSLTVREGEFLCIVGHTGSGKSTLIQHINGILQPDSGSVVIDGFDMSQKKQMVDGRKRVGMVFQYPEYQLFEETVYKDVAFGPTNMGLTEPEIRERVLNAMISVGLLPEFFLEKSPFELSGGEKRRAALAGILAMQPNYLILDEPMAGLDPSGRRSILSMLEDIRTKYGTTIVMVSHSMDDIARVADRIAVLNNGRLIMLDTPKAIFGTLDLEAIGLELPHVAKLTKCLRQLGLELDDGIYEDEELISTLLGRYKNA